jgi:CheY-like chemotaxis protein
MKPSSPHRPERAGAPIVLAVDDQTDYLDALEALLVGEGYNVVTSSSAADALVRAREFTPTVLITDLNMEPCDGVELLHNLAEDHLLPGVPRVILSSAPEEVVRRRMRECVVEAEVIDKNGDVGALLDAIGKLCEGGAFRQRGPEGGS